MMTPNPTETAVATSAYEVSDTFWEIGAIISRPQTANSPQPGFAAGSLPCASPISRATASAKLSSRNTLTRAPAFSTSRPASRLAR
jgi:hypothetical protein